MKVNLTPEALKGHLLLNCRYPEIRTAALTERLGLDTLRSSSNSESLEFTTTPRDSALTNFEPACHPV